MFLGNFSLAILIVGIIQVIIMVRKKKNSPDNKEPDMSHKRKREDNRRLKKLYEDTKNSYGAGAYYDDRKKRYVRVYVRRSHTKKDYKRYSNKRLRQNRSVVLRGNKYRRVFDYWWELL